VKTYVLSYNVLKLNNMLFDIDMLTNIMIDLTPVEHDDVYSLFMTEINIFLTKQTIND